MLLMVWILRFEFFFCWWGFQIGERGLFSRPSLPPSMSENKVLQREKSTTDSLPPFSPRKSSIFGPRSMWTVPNPQMKLP